MPEPVSRKELIRKLRALGFVGPFSGGRHQFMEQKGRRIVIPNPHGKDIGSSLISQILRDVSVSAEKFEEI